MIRKATCSIELTTDFEKAEELAGALKEKLGVLSMDLRVEVHGNRVRINAESHELDGLRKLIQLCSSSVRSHQLRSGP